MGKDSVEENKGDLSDFIFYIFFLLVTVDLVFLLLFLFFFHFQLGFLECFSRSAMGDNQNTATEKAYLH